MWDSTIITIVIMVWVVGPAHLTGLVTPPSDCRTLTPSRLKPGSPRPWETLPGGLFLENT